MSLFADIAAFFSAHFAVPAFFAFFALIPIVVLLYLLKLRRTEIIIPSTLLWIKSLDDLTANAPFQKLKKNLLMFLQIAILALIALALARPIMKTEGLTGSNLCLIIDASASMQTIEGGKTRLDLAKEAALKMIDEMSRGDKMMIVVFGETASVLCELTDDRYRLRSSVNSIRPSDSRTNIREVIRIARSIAPDNPDVPAVAGDLKLVLMSDGKISDVDELGALPVDIRFLQIGESSDNAGIAAFSARSPIEGENEKQVFIMVHNENAAPLETTLSLYRDDSLIAVKEIEVPPSENREFVFAIPGVDEGALRAEIDRKDALDVDNRAWISLHPGAKIKVLLAAQGDSTGAYFIKRVLSLDARVELSAVEPSNYKDTGKYDLTIFENNSPATMPRGSLMFINSLPPIQGVSAGGEIANPPILMKESNHILMRFISPENVIIRKAMRFSIPTGATNLLSTSGGPLIADVSREGQQILIIGFDVADSNWPLHLSFPLFFQNLLSWLPRGAAGEESSVSAGRPLTIMPSPEYKTAVVTLPDGREETVELDALHPVYYGNTEKVGIYRVTRGGQSDIFAVNLLDKNESSITPAQSLKIGRGEAAAERGSIKQNRELWRWFIVAALFILCIEWWIYSRRAWM